MARIKGIRLGMKRKRNTNNVGDPKDKSSSTSSDSSDVVPAGFIFLCNNKTKPRCFQYQVFGLSISQKKTVEKIKPGTKLFLFDYEMRLLHGVYEAVSQGKVELEPHAFQGKYLAQVKFRIVGECLPVQEKYFKSAILENYRAGRLRLELSEQQVNKLVPLFHPFPVRASSSSEPGELMTLTNAASPHPSLPQRRENQYHNKNFSRLHSLDNLQHQHQPTAGAVVDHVQHHRIIQNPIHLHDHAHSHHELYSTRGHTLTVQEPYHPRHITGQEWLPQNHTMGLANDYHQLPLIMRQPRHFPHPQEIDPTWYHHHHQLQFLRENPTSGENLTAFATVVTNPNSLSTMQPPHASPYVCPELPYLVTGPYVSSTVQTLIPPTFGVLPHERTFSLPTNYVSTTMHSSSYVPASTVWPEQNYPTILPAAAASYASPSGWLEPNPPMSTASNNYVTMQSHAPLSGMPPLNVPISSFFSFVGSENPFTN